MAEKTPPSSHKRTRVGETPSPAGRTRVTTPNSISQCPTQCVTDPAGTLAALVLRRRLLDVRTAASSSVTQLTDSQAAEYAQLKDLLKGIDIKFKSEFLSK